MYDSKQIALPEGEYAKYLASVAAEMADEKARLRDSKWRATFGAIFTVLAIFGYVNISSIKNEIEARIAYKLPSEVKSYVDNNRSVILGETISTLQSDLEARMALLQLVIAASELRNDDGFTHEKRNAVVDLLEQVGSNKVLINSSQFAKPLEDIVDAFLQADQDVYIDDIDDKLRKIVSIKSGITTSMLQHYGIRVLGAAILNEADVKRLEYYALISSDSFNSPENAAPFLLGLAFIRADFQRNSVGESVFQDALHWNVGEKKSFINFCRILREGKFFKRPTGKTDRVVALMQEVYQAYQHEFDSLEEDDTDESIENSQLRELLQDLALPEVEDAISDSAQPDM